MARRWILLAGALLALTPAAGSAQTGTACDLVQPADLRRIINAQGEEVLYFLDPVRMECDGGVRLAADSAVFNQARSALELIGAVAFRDSTSQLESGWANYLGRQGLLLARDNVVLTDLADGSVVTGQQLEYQRETESRTASRVIIRGGRPRAVLRRAAGAATGASADTAAPLEVVSDRMEIIDESLFHATGAVELKRGETEGAADSARYDQGTGRMLLVGDAWVADPRYRLEGERVDAALPGDELREVVAQDSARLLSEELEVDAERLVLSFADGRLSRMEAWTPTAPPTARAVAVSDGFRLSADSIDARADSGVIREVRAVGQAYGERELDSLEVGLPEVATKDWIRGDTIIGYFAQVPPPATDPVGTPLETGGATATDSVETVLERVVVIGGDQPALSLYRMESDEGGSRPSINFMKATRIVLFLSQGEVTRVEADGPIEGVYLDPTQPAPAGGEAADGEASP